MKLIAIFTAVLLLINSLYDFGLLVWSFWDASLAYGEFELPYALRYVINNLLWVLTQGMLGLFLMLFASNSK
tara:strand:+ start:319 stop:534 length:216 start_codon:yes stop_codon:yes gene_type:complete